MSNSIYLWICDVILILLISDLNTTSLHMENLFFFLIMLGLVMRSDLRMRTDRSHAVGLNASKHTQIIRHNTSVYNVHWSIRAQQKTAYHSAPCYVVKVMTFAALGNWCLWLCSCIWAINLGIIIDMWYLFLTWNIMENFFSLDPNAV